MIRIFKTACFLVIILFPLQASAGRGNDIHHQLLDSLTSGQEKAPRDVLQRSRRLSKKKSKKSKPSKSESAKKKYFRSKSSSSNSSADGKGTYTKGDSRSAYGNSWSKSTLAGEAGGWSDAGGKDEFDNLPSEAPFSSPNTMSPPATQVPTITSPTASPAPTCLECDDYPDLKLRSQADLATNASESKKQKVIFIGSVFLLALASGIIMMARKDRDKGSVHQQPVKSDDETSSEASSNQQGA